MGKKFHSMLMLFVGNTEVSKFRLNHGRYTEQDVKEALDLGLIVEVRKNNNQDAVYCITEAGRRYRDA